MTSAQGEWRHGWPAVAAGLAGMIVMALHFGPLMVMMKPLGDIFGWSRAEISAGLLIIMVIQFPLGPVIGLLIPRFGVRNVAAAGTILYGVGTGMLGLCGPSIWSWYLGWAVIGIGWPAISALVWTAAIARLFTRHRGLAMSVVLAGTGIALFLAPLVTAYTLEAFGWRAPFFVLSAFTLLVGLPVLWWLTGLRPEFGPLATAGAGPVQAVAAPSAAYRDLLSNTRVWRLVVVSPLLAAAFGLISTQFQAIMRDAGISATAAAGYFAVAGPCLIFGRLVSGLLLDRLPPRLVSAALFVLPGLVCLVLLTYDGSAFWGIVACVLFGLGYGAEADVLAYLVSRYFSPNQYPVVYGMVLGCFNLAYGVAPVVGGGVYDLFGSYARILMALIAGIVVAVLLVLSLGRENPLTEG